MVEKNAQNLVILQYGFSIEKKEIKESIITDNIDNVVARVKKEIEQKNDPLSAVLIGVDTPWEVCLLKLMVELVQESASGNMKNIQNRSLKEKRIFLIKLIKLLPKHHVNQIV